jgi:hypothetical protein
MQISSAERLLPNRVVAVFNDRAVFFDLSPVATLEDLSNHLSQLLEQHGEALVSVDVRISSSAKIARLSNLVGLKR